MSTSIAGVHAPTTTAYLATNAQISDRYPELEHTEDEAGQIVLVLDNHGNSQLVIVDGTLNELRTFIRDLHNAVRDRAGDESDIAEENA